MHETHILKAILGGRRSAVRQRSVADRRRICRTALAPFRDRKVRLRFECHRNMLARLNALHVRRAANGIDDTMEFHQQTVAHELDQATVMGTDRWLEDLM